MRLLILATIVVAMGGAMTAKAGSPPIYPKVIDGALVSGLFDRRTAQIRGGSADDCKVTVTGDWMTYQCEAKDASVTVNGGGGRALDLKLNKVFVWYRTYEKRFIREYTFWGDHTEKVGAQTLKSRVLLIVYHYDDEPNRYFGKLELPDLGVSESFQGEAAGGL